ncbi:hypothetical protein ACGFSI_19175 [Streptomyces virginiae]|uniref:hypothetical protein n=1 Tax=Streptomyces virginiae TaxID=1961 RepID=UPI00372484A1
MSDSVAAGPARPLGHRGLSPAPRADFVTGPTDAAVAVAVAVGVRGRAAIAFGYEGAALPIADVFADRAIALSGNQPSLGLLNAVFGKARTAALRGDHPTTRRLLAEGRCIFDRFLPGAATRGRREVTSAVSGARVSAAPALRCGE